MILENRYTHYKYSTNGSFDKQENSVLIKNHKKRPLPFVLRAMGIGCLAFVVGLIIILYVYQCVQINNLNYQITACEKTLEELEMKNQTLALKIAQENSLKEIEKKARERYDMVEPEELHYLTLKKDIVLDGIGESQNPINKTNLLLVVRGVADWFKSLTSVEAGTLDE